MSSTEIVSRQALEEEIGRLQQMCGGIKSRLAAATDDDEARSLHGLLERTQEVLDARRDDLEHVVAVDMSMRQAERGVPRDQGVVADDFGPDDGSAMYRHARDIQKVAGEVDWNRLATTGAQQWVVDQDPRLFGDQVIVREAATDWITNKVAIVADPEHRQRIIKRFVSNVIKAADTITIDRDDSTVNVVTDDNGVSVDVQDSMGFADEGEGFGGEEDLALDIQLESEDLEPIYAPDEELGAEMLVEDETDPAWMPQEEDVISASKVRDPSWVHMYGVGYRDFSKGLERTADFKDDDVRQAYATGQEDAAKGISNRISASREQLDADAKQLRERLVAKLATDGFELSPQDYQQWSQDVATYAELQGLKVPDVVVDITAEAETKVAATPEELETSGLVEALDDLLSAMVEVAQFADHSDNLLEAVLGSYDYAMLLPHLQGDNFGWMGGPFVIDQVRTALERAELGQVYSEDDEEDYQE